MRHHKIILLVITVLVAGCDQETPSASTTATTSAQALASSSGQASKPAAKTCTIRLSRRELTLDGVEAGHTRDATDMGRLTKIDALAVKLKALARQDVVFRLEFDDQASGIEYASVMLTLSDSGFTGAQLKTHVGWASVVLEPPARYRARRNGEPMTDEEHGIVQHTESGFELSWRRGATELETELLGGSFLYDQKEKHLAFGGKEKLVAAWKSHAGAKVLLIVPDKYQRFDELAALVAAIDEVKRALGGQGRKIIIGGP